MLQRINNKDIMQKINRKQHSSTSSVFKLWFLLVAKLKYYYHRLLRRTLQGSVRYSATHPGHFNFIVSYIRPSEEGMSLLHKSFNNYHIGIISLFSIFKNSAINMESSKSKGCVLVASPF